MWRNRKDPYYWKPSKTWKKLFALLLIVYTVIGFWLNVIADFESLLNEGNDGKWICYIVIFCSSPNFKHLICSFILLAPNVQLLQEQEDHGHPDLNFKKFRRRLVAILVTIPGVILYFIPMIYCLLALIVLCFCFAFGGLMVYFDVYEFKILDKIQSFEWDFICNKDDTKFICSAIGIWFIMLMALCAFILFMLWTADVSACLIHELEDCRWRMSWSQYMDKIESNTVGTLRMTTFMFDIIF